MEFATRSTKRLNQFSELYEKLSQSHLQLQSKFTDQKKKMIEYKTKANYWEAQFQQLKSREEELRAENEELKGLLRKREQQLFGRSSEKNAKQSEQGILNKTLKKRGQQLGSKGHGRRDYQNLPMVEETLELKETHTNCSCCGLPYKELPGSEDSEVLEVINVQAYRRVIHRKRYQRCCSCEKNSDPRILLAPRGERIFPKSKLGVSIWALLLMNKYEYQQPLYRSLEQLSHHGLSLAMGTVTDGMQKLLPFFIPVYDAIVVQSVAARHWHADETGWKVFEALEGKKNHRWFLWIFHNKETVVYKIRPSRSSQVLTEYFGEDHPGGILNVDRYGAYKVIAKSGLFILAFCWAHVRRDFLEHAKGYVNQEAWALAWVERIGKLYHINNQRIQYTQKSKAFRTHDHELRKAISDMREALDQQYQDASLLPSAKKLLKSLNEHWSGLTVFIDDPEIPMDNNQAERGLRSSVLGRKNYYGSGAIWSAELAAALFTILETIKLWEMNPHTWLLAYLHECAMNDGSPPDTIEKYLPWKMTPELRKLFAKPPIYENAPMLST